MFLSLFSTFTVAGFSSSIIHTTSVDQLQKAFTENNRKNTLIYLCENQVKKKRIPSACYKLAKLKETNSQSFIDYIDEKCLELSFELDDLKNISHSIKNFHISKKCLSHLSKEIDILEIQIKDSPIKRIINSYIKE